MKLLPILMLIISNVFMTYAWYGHLKTFKGSALWIAIVVSWGVAFFEYCFQVPANRLGAESFTVPQLKIIQEVITMVVFAFFSIYFLKVPITKNFFFASICMVAATYFIFQDK